MAFTRTLFDRTFFFIGGVFLFSFWGFWVTYFTRPPETLVTWDHLHGIAMYVWLVLMVIQAGLIRFKHRKLHRALGKVSYALVPVIFVSTFFVSHFYLNARELSDEGVYILGLQFVGLIPFTIFYCLAMLNRAKPDVHARWMVCVGATLLDPVFARIIGINFLQVPFESGIINAITFGGVAVLMLVLTVLDYRDSGRRDVFLPAMLIMAVPQALCLLAWDTGPWRAFAAWYAALPLT